MVKHRVQAQHLMPGDVVGTGEVVENTIISSIQWPSNKCMVKLSRKLDCGALVGRNVLWGKRTMINVERKDGNSVGR